MVLLSFSLIIFIHNCGRRLSQQQKKEFSSMFGLLNKNSIPKIARVLPPVLIDAFEKQNFYSASDVKRVFDRQFNTEHNIEYAFAMFCSPSDFESLNVESSYNELRADVAKKCFAGWPRFNFESLLDYSRRLTMGGDGGNFGGDSGCGDGGCGGGGGE
jgi:hypothetical protein